MLDQPPYLFVVRTDVDASADAEFNRWYSEVHAPEIASCPGFLFGHRYSLIDSEYTAFGAGGDQRYLAVYGVENPRAFASPDFLERRGWGPGLEAAVRNTSPALYEAIPPSLPLRERGHT